MKRTKRNKIITIVLILLLLIAVGYAALQSNLNISGTAKTSGKWDIHFENNSDEDISTISTDKQTLTVNANLTTPGEKQDLSVDIVNGGTIDAYLTGFNISMKNGENVEIPANGGSYTSGVIKITVDNLEEKVNVETGKLTANGGKTTYNMSFEWPEEAIQEGENLEETMTFEITFTYSQTEGSSTTIPETTNE